MFGLNLQNYSNQKLSHQKVNFNDTEVSISQFREDMPLSSNSDQ